MIKMLVQPKKKECWRNAALLSLYFPNVEYVEGRLLAAGIIGIDHGFNKVGDKYIDITAELCLNFDVEKESYIKIQEYNSGEVLELSEKYESYCSFHQHAFNEKLRKILQCQKEILTK